MRCDDKLRELFHVDSLDLARMSEALKPHLTAPPPVTLQYTIRWVGGWVCNAAWHQGVLTLWRVGV